MTYKALSYPTVVGGGPGARETVALTVTATGAASATPVLAQVDLAAYAAAATLDKTRHERFSDIVRFFSRYGQPISISVNNPTGTIISLGYEVVDLFEDQSKGKPGWFTAASPRKTAYELAQEYVALNDFLVSAITVTIDGAAQSS